MSDTIIVGLLSLFGTFIGSFSGINLIKYRIEQLEKKVEKHNNLIERTYQLEEKDIEVTQRITYLEREVERLCH